jgi:hypothetical protein
MTYTSFTCDPCAESGLWAAGPRTVDISTDTPLFTEVLTVSLLQLGYATLPPRWPDEVHTVLAAAGLMEHEKAYYIADDLENWQPDTACHPTGSTRDAGTARGESADRAARRIIVWNGPARQERAVVPVVITVARLSSAGV